MQYRKNDGLFHLDNSDEHDTFVKYSYVNRRSTFDKVGYELAYTQMKDIINISTQWRKNRVKH